METRPGSRSGGFTLYEILVTIAIVAIVGVLAVPQVQKAGLKSKISLENANIALLQEAKEAYASANPGTELSSAQDLLPYLPNETMPQSPFGTEYQNVTDLSKPVVSGSSDVPATEPQNNFVSLAKSTTTGFNSLEAFSTPSTTTVTATGVTPTPTDSVTPTPEITPTPEVNNNPSVMLTANPRSTYRGVPVTLRANAVDIDGDPLTFSFTASGYNYGASPDGILTLEFPTLGNQPLSVFVSDGRGGSAVADTSVDILNRAPDVSLTSSLAKTYRNNPITFEALGTDLDADPLTYRFTINNDEPLEASTNSILETGFSELGIQNVTVLANDGFGGLATNSTTVEITNRPPTLSIEANPLSTYRGGDFLFTAKASDPDNDPLTYTFGVEGVSQPPSQSSTLTKSFSTLGKKSVWAYVSDGLGGQIERSLTVNVTNRPPIATLAASAASTYPDSDVVFTTTASDLDNDPLSYTFTVDGQELAKSTNPVITRSFSTLGQKSVSVLVEDGQGTENAIASVVVDVTEVPNTAPSVTLIAEPSQGVRGQTFSFKAAGTDPEGDSLQYSFNGGAYGNTNTYRTTYTTLGSQTVTVKAKDPRGAESSPASAMVNILNRAPSASVAVDRATTVRGGQSVFTVSGSDPDGDALVYRVRINGALALPISGIPSDGSWSAWGNWATSFNPSFFANGTMTVEAQAKEVNSGLTSNIASASVLVENRLPTIVLSSSSLNGYIGEELTLTARGEDLDHGGRGTSPDVLKVRFRGDGITTTASGWSAWTDGVLLNPTTYPSTYTFTLPVKYTTSGIKKVEAQVTDNFGGLSTIASVNLNIINEAPWAQVNSSVAKALRGQSVTFTGSGGDPEGQPIVYSFNGGAYGSATNLTTSYNTLGVKTVTLKVRDPQGLESSTASASVEVVNAAPQASLVANPPTVPRGVATKVTLTASGSDPDSDPLSYKFTIPGKVMAASATNSTQATTAATTTYTVDVSDGNGGVAAASATVTAVNVAPTVTLVANPTSTTTGSNVTFTASGSDANGDALSYRFKVGSGAWVSSSSNVYTTSFSSTGTQTVTVEVNDGQGGTAQDSASVSVGAPNQAPSVSISANPTTGVRGQTFTFTATGSDPEGGSLQYSFNGGVYGSANTYSTSYSSLGSQTVTVKAKDPQGAESAPASVTVSVVNRAPTVTISANPTQGLRGKSFTFTASGSDLDGDSLTYSFNNGAYGSSTTLTTSYSSLGTQTVSVKAKDSQGAESSPASVTVSVVNGIPTVTISANPTTGFRGQTFTYTATGTDPDGETLQYSFDNGAYGSSNSMTATYTTVGTKTVSVKVKDPQGAESAQASVSVSVVNRAPTVTLTASPTSGETGQTFTFTASGSDADGDALTYSFQVGSGAWGAYGTTTTLAQAYATAGSQTVSVKAKDALGAESAPASATVTVVEPPAGPSVTLVANPTTVFRKQSVTYTATGRDANPSTLKYSFSVDGGAWSSYVTANTTTKSFTTLGAHTVDVKVKNSANVESAPASATVSVINQKPTVSIVADSSTSWKGDSVKFTASGADADGDTLKYSFKVGSGTWSAYGIAKTLNQTFTSVGNQTVYAKVIDENGLESDIASVTVVVNKKVFAYWNLKAQKNESSTIITIGNRGGESLTTWKTKLQAFASSLGNAGYVKVSNGSGKVQIADSTPWPGFQCAWCGWHQDHIRTWQNAYFYLGYEVSANIILVDQDGALISTVGNTAANRSAQTGGLNKAVSGSANSVLVGWFEGNQQDSWNEYYGATWRTQDMTPVVIDLTGTGNLDLLAGPSWTPGNRRAVFSAMRKFDMGDGEVRQWEWVGPKAGLLVWNPEGKKTFNVTGKDLFGSHTWGKNWHNGYEPLKTLDKDGNNFLDQAEAKNISVWSDKNSDAIVQEGELEPLGTYGIQSVLLETTKTEDGGFYASPGVEGVDKDGKPFMLGTYDWISVGNVDGGAEVSQTLPDGGMTRAIYHFEPNPKAPGFMQGLVTFTSSTKEGFSAAVTSPGVTLNGNFGVVTDKDGVISWKTDVPVKGSKDVNASYEVKFSSDYSKGEVNATTADGKSYTGEIRLAHGVTFEQARRLYDPLLAR